MNALPRTAPEAQGASSAGLAAFVTALDEIDDVHTVMVLKGGSVITESSWAPYAAEMPHMMFSVSKSFTATAIGLLISEGRLSLDDRVIELLAAEAPAEPSDNLSAMTVRHLLTMTTGHATDTVSGVRPTESGWTRTLLGLPVDLVPGSTFVYNTGATYLLSAIVQQVSGERLLDYLQPRLLAPLGIMDAAWEESPDGVNTGGYGLRIVAEDLARFGQLYLQHGQWEGAQLVPAEWISSATSLQVPSVGDSPQWQAGYGYQFWQNSDGSYRADGAFGQFCLVLDELDAVVVITAGTENTTGILDAVFEFAAPALSGVPAGRAEPRATVTQTPVASDREFTQEFFYPTNPLKITAMTLSGNVLTIDEQEIPFGVGEWVTGGRYRINGVVEELAASGGWIDDTHFVIELRALQTAYVYLITLTIEGDTIDLRVEQNVSFNPKHTWRLVGGIKSDEPTKK